MVKVEGNDNVRQKRQFYFNYPQVITPVIAAWSKSSLGSACLTSKGILGYCQTFKKCYPFFKFPEPITKFPNLNAWDYWVLGNYDTCSYFTDDGRQAFGVCCTNAIEDDSSATKPDEQKYETPKPPSQNGIFGAWPPPIPTHPPDHTAATHPPNFGIQFVPAGVETTTQLSTTTWATRPPSQLQTTSKRPSFIPTTPENVFSDESYVGSSCGAKNGNPVFNKFRIYMSFS